ncbi:MAG: DUF4247 domain-containing protein [Actinomycetota bacterium]|nr:DUF4247 domain-containing protein [Actinomycetota bacterium]
MRSVMAAALAAVLLAGCGSGNGPGEIAQYVAETYEVTDRREDNVEARSDDSVSEVASDIVSIYEPNERHDEEAGTFLRYDEEFVAVRPDPDNSGSLISVDNSETGSSRWVPIIGPIFLPGGRYGGPRRGGFGGAGDTGRGGGPGTGK